MSRFGTFNSYLENLIQHIKLSIMIVKPVLLGDVSICRKLHLKLQKGDKGDGARHKTPVFF